jgi:hypothetical protein
VYKWLHLSHCFLECCLNIEVFHTLQHVRSRTHLKFLHKLVFTLGL